VILDHACADPLFRKAIRVSMGQVFNVPWAVAEDWRRMIESLRERCGAKIIAAEPDPRAASLDGFAFPPRCAIVVGAERRGIAPETLGLADYIVEIPMARADTSLNVAVASAVVLHEWRRSVASSQAR
jgi:tRNA G18 (ribose-2'-O)-methylase SpoU